jgi:hypothetical protein
MVSDTGRWDTCVGGKQDSAATEAVREELGAASDEDEETIRAKGLELLGREDPLGRGSACAGGRGLDLAAALELWPLRRECPENGLTMRIPTNIPHN